MTSVAVVRTEAGEIGTDRRFFTGMALAALVVVFLGFSTSYYLWPITRATHYASGLPISPSVPLIVHIHALGFSGWVLLLVAQTGLVAAGRRDVHRRLGIASAWLVPILAVTGLMTAVRGARDGWNPGGPFADSFSFLVVGVVDILVFTVVTGAGLTSRRRPEVHKRLMLLGTVGGLLWAAITRIPFLAGRFVPMFALLTLLVLAPAIRDFWRGSEHRWLSLSVGVGILATILLRPLIGATATWRTFATWLAG